MPRNSFSPGFSAARRARAWRRHAFVVAFAASLAACGRGAPLTGSAAGSAAWGQYIFDTFGTEAGLPQPNVTAVCQARDGYLWVGTEAGLGRFDGVRFVAFKRSNTPAFARDQSIRRIFEDRDGALWIGTESGIVRQRAGVFEHLGLTGMIVTAIAQDRSGRMWFGTEGRGVQTYQDGQFRSFESESAMLGSAVRSIFVDSADRVWIGFARSPGAVCYEGGRFRFQAIDGAKSRETFAIAEWPRGTLWFGCGRGLYRLHDGRLVQCDAGRVPSPLQVTDLQPARNGGVWVVAGPILHITRAEPFAFDQIARLPVTTARTAIEDREGSMWICAQFEGLLRARRTFYRTVTTDDGLPGNVLKCVTQDSAGNTWLAIQSQGVTRVGPGGDIEVWSREHGFPSRYPLSVYVATDGTVWASFSVGLAAWHDGPAEVFPEHRSVRIIHEDRHGTMWFGNDEELWMRPAGGPFTRIELDGRTPTTVNAIADGPDGAIYVATAPGGLTKIKDGHLTAYPETSRFITSGVRALYVDRQERVWVGIKGRGLGVLVDGRWYNPDALADAVTDHVSAIAEDAHGQLWLGTPSGIVWGAKDELLAVARGEQALPHLRLAGVDDGVRATPASSHSQPAVWTTRDHTLLFATRHGLLEINPESVPPNQIAPPVHIEQIVVDGRPKPRTGQIELAPGDRQLAIEYTALSFVDSRRVTFRYKLEGYDRDWVEAGTRRLASYANLPSGRYVFRVIASNSDGQWNEVGDRLRIRQIPSFYETWWFAALGCAAVGLIGLGLFRWSRRRLQHELERLEQKHLLERERRRIAKNLHDDLGADLTEIGLFAEAARRRTPLPEATADLVALSDRVRGLVGSLDAIVWATNPANDSLDQVATYICEYFQSLFARSAIRCRVDVAGDMPAFPLTPEERTNLFLTAKEAMNNALKHSGARQVWLRMKMSGDRFCLSLEDDGRGFDPAAPENVHRHGLQNMRSRIEELSGTFAIETQRGQCTRVAISVSFAGKAPLFPAAETDLNGPSRPAAVS